MTAYTPIYALPFQELPWPPDGPNLGEDLALAIEALLVSMDASLDALEAGGYTYQQTIPVTASGNFVKATYPGLRAVMVHVYGPGGAGGGSGTTIAGQSSKGAGGASGGYSRKFILASALAASEVVTVGTGGVGAANANGGNGSGASS